MKNEVLTITDEKVDLPNGQTVMHEWEHPIMKVKADYVCQNGGDIIEFGFGMGISADYIQQHDIKSHTICEIHPQIIERLHIWAQDKPNVIILEGDWWDNIDKMKKYNGILFDTHMDLHARDFHSIIPKISHPGCLLTWWNNKGEEYNEFRLKGTTFDILNVDPPLNNYFNYKQYYMPKYVYK